MALIDRAKADEDKVTDSIRNTSFFRFDFSNHCRLAVFHSSHLIIKKSMTQLEAALLR